MFGKLWSTQSRSDPALAPAISLSSYGVHLQIVKLVKSRFMVSSETGFTIPDIDWISSSDHI
jgi:hypothetical protein